MRHLVVEQRQEIGIDTATRGVVGGDVSRDTMFEIVNRSVSHAHKPMLPTQFKTILAIKEQLPEFLASDGFSQVRGMIADLQRDAFTAVQLSQYGVHPHKSAKGEICVERAIRTALQTGEENQSTIPEPVCVWVEELGQRIADILMAERDARRSRKDDVGDYSAVLTADLTLQPLYRAMLADDSSILDKENALCPWSSTIEDHLFQIRSCVMQVCMEYILSQQKDQNAWYRGMMEQNRKVSTLNENKFTYLQKDWMVYPPTSGFLLEGLSTQVIDAAASMRMEILAYYRRLQNYSQSMMAVAVREGKTVLAHALNAAMGRQGIPRLAAAVAPLMEREDEECETWSTQIPVGPIRYAETLPSGAVVSFEQRSEVGKSVLSVQEKHATTEDGYMLSCTMREGEEGTTLIPGDASPSSLLSLPQTSEYTPAIHRAMEVCRRTIHAIWTCRPDLMELAQCAAPLHLHRISDTEAVIACHADGKDALQALFPHHGRVDPYTDAENKNMVRIRVPLTALQPVGALEPMDDQEEAVLLEQIGVDAEELPARTLAATLYKLLEGRAIKYREFNRVLERLGVSTGEKGGSHMKIRHKSHVTIRSYGHHDKGIIPYNYMAQEIYQLNLDPHEVMQELSAAHRTRGSIPALVHEKP